MDIKKVIGWNLRRIRVAQKITQEALALEADIDRAYVGRIERGQENVTVAALAALAQVLNVPVAKLFFEPKGPVHIPGLRAGRKPKKAKSSN